MSFAQRLYISLDVDLTRVRLYQPLGSIVKQPLLYVRDMIPKLCFDAVTKLFQVCWPISRYISTLKIPNLRWPITTTTITKRSTINEHFTNKKDLFASKKVCFPPYKQDLFTYTKKDLLIYTKIPRQIATVNSHGN